MLRCRDLPIATVAYSKRGPRRDVFRILSGHAEESGTGVAGCNGKSVRPERIASARLVHW